jgi:hypothetical protein
MDNPICRKELGELIARRNKLIVQLDGISHDTIFSAKFEREIADRKQELDTIERLTMPDRRGAILAQKARKKRAPCR